MKQIFLILFLSFCFGSANAQICESLFGDSELYRTIHSLAELRLRLDLAQTSNDDSITISLLRKECEQKEKAILKHVLQAGLMTQERFKELIKLEIQSLQKSSLDVSKDRARQKAQVEEAAFFDRFQAKFNSFTPKDNTIKPFEIMMAPVTRALWEYPSLALKKDGPTIAHEKKEDLFPISEVSYYQVLKWIDGLNKLSKNGDPDLEKLFKDHKPGDRYSLPSLSQLSSLTKEARAPKTGDLHSWISKPNEDVTSRKPLFAQEKIYYGLSDLGYFIKDYTMDGDTILTESFEPRLEQSDPNYFSIRYYTLRVEAAHNYSETLTFRLTRERKQP